MTRNAGSAHTKAGNDADGFGPEPTRVVDSGGDGGSLRALLPARAAGRVPAAQLVREGGAAPPLPAPARGAGTQRQADAAVSGGRDPVARRTRGAGPGEPAVGAVAAGQHAGAAPVP